MKRSRFLLHIALVAFFAFVMISVNGCTDKKPDAISIGAILPLTGPAAQMGQEMQRGQLLAKEYWNNNRDKHKTPNVNLIIEDSKSTPKDALSAYMKLRTQNVSIFTANLSSVCLALLPKASEEDILLFADAAQPEITKNPNPRVFRNSSTSELEAQEISKSLLQKKINKVSILYINHDYGLGFLKELQKTLEPKIDIADISFDANTQDYRPFSFKALQNKPEAIIIVGIGKSIGLLIRSLRTLEYTGDIYTNIGYLLTGGREAAGNARKGIYYTEMKVPITEPGKWAKVEYEKRYEKSIPAEALLEFNTISLIALASKNTNFDPMDLSNNMKSAVNELLGPGRLNSKGDILPDMVVNIDEGN